MTAHSKALNKAGGYTDEKGIYHKTKAEQKATMKSWPKHKKGGSVDNPETDDQKRAYQNKYNRAWND